MGVRPRHPRPESGAYITPKEKDAEGQIQKNIGPSQCHQSRVPICVHLGSTIDDGIKIATLFHEDEYRQYCGMQ